MGLGEFELAGWRRSVHELYAAVRSTSNAVEAREVWRLGRDALFRTDPQSPLPAGDPMRSTGIPLWPYDERFRFSLALRPPMRERLVAVPTDGTGATRMRLLGTVAVPDPVAATLGVWWLEQYGGGIFVPVRDRTAGQETYGGGRYLLDTAKGADLGGTRAAIVIDFNFAYHPSCRYDPAWECPLAPAENTVGVAIPAGERLAPQ